MVGKGSKAIVLAGILVGFGVGLAAAATPAALFEGGTFGGAGNLLSVLRVPVRTSTGAIVYKDVRIAFSVSANGTLTVAAGYPKITASPVLLTGSFVAGNYTDGDYTYAVSGPGVGPGGRTTWRIVGTGSCELTGGWTSGAIAGHPQQARLNAAGITFAGYSYGVFGENNCLPFTQFGQGHLLGASGSPTGITLFSYTDDTDHPTPVGQASFTRCTASNPCP